MLSLPTPTREYVVHEDREVVPAVAAVKRPPAYRQRAGFVPRAAADHGDGGAFPEIHVAQYPLGMGRKGEGGSGPGDSSGSLALTVGAQGQAAFDAVAKRGHSGDAAALMQTTYESLVARNSTAADNARLAAPSAAEEAAAAAKTEEALQGVLRRKLEQSRAVQVVDNSASASSVAKPTFVAYQPQGAGEGEGRVIRLVTAAADPLELPKFKHKKQPRAAAVEAPAPILQSVPDKLSKEDKAAWQIPPVISAWKNQQGFTIPLDKRMAADGRGLAPTTVSDRFASLSEALYIAENQARAEIEARNQEKQFLLGKEKERREEELRQMAAQARESRDAQFARSKLDTFFEGAGARAGATAGAGAGAGAAGATAAAAAAATAAARSPSPTSDDEEPGSSPPGLVGRADPAAEAERELLRRERKRERERALRLEAAGKKSKLMRDEERDVSEKIALGMAVPRTAALSGEAAFDSRLFNQSAGLGGGFGADDEYNVYSKPLFDRGANSGGLYRPKASEGAQFGSAEQQLDRIKSTDRFQAERAPGQAPHQHEADPFDIGRVLGAGGAGEARRPGERMDKAISQRGGSMAVSSASRGDDALLGSGRTRINFTKGGA
jgi:SNW domain-containing protein 1